MNPQVDRLEQQVVAALGSFMSPMNARTLFQRAARGASGSRDGGDVSGIVGRMRSGIRLFVRPQDVTRAEAALDALAAPTLPVGSITVDLSSEADLHNARSAARDACMALGARPLTTQKLLTVVSELTRNVIMYTPGGRLSIRPDLTRPASITIVCEDRGTGIENLDDILSGRYRSRTGLGKGIAGVKKLMDSFEIESGPTGTRIIARAVVAAGAIS